MFRLLSKQILKPVAIHHCHPIRVISSAPMSPRMSYHTNYTNLCLRNATSKIPGTATTVISTTPPAGAGAPSLIHLPPSPGKALLNWAMSDVACVRLDHLGSGQKEMKADIKDLSNKMERKSESVENKFDKKFESMENRFDKKFESVDDRFHKKFDQLSLKFDKGLCLLVAGFAGLAINTSLKHYREHNKQVSVAETRFISSSLAPSVEKRV
ncbi:hypothetical protein HOY80DRAFT_1133220 [Tuber brumale]|nr:hypothetical protein HOY80DRAFT_1133220 [Tuber brumale]